VAVTDRWSGAGDRSPTRGWRPLVAPSRRPQPIAGDDQWSPTGCGPPHELTGAESFFNFFENSCVLIYFLRPVHVARAWASWGVGCTVPQFLKYAPTLGSANFSKIHGEWRFLFSPKKVFAKFSPYLDLHIYCWDFCFMKN
jgi:hypothetical protein